MGGVGGPVYSSAAAAGCMYVGGRFDRVCACAEHAAALVAAGLLPADARRATFCRDESTPGI